MEKVLGKMITNNFFRRLLLQPALDGGNRLKIISAEATPAMAFYHLNKLRSSGIRDIEISLIVGDTSEEKLHEINHLGFKVLTSNYFRNNFECLYRSCLPYPNSKLYIWLKGDKPLTAFTGSINYTMSGFNEYMRLESAVECDPEDAESYFNKLSKDTQNCMQLKSNENKSLNSPISESQPKLLRSFAEKMPNLPEAKITLLDRTGKLHKHGGLNWGQRAGRNKDQAYIQIPIKIYRSEFFPPPSAIFTVLADDSELFFFTRAQKIEGTAIHSLPNNNILGAYFRKRLNLPSGAFVREKDLESYGRTDVTFYKQDEESYLMDFSKKNG